MNNEVITVNKGQKIAQAVLCPVVSGKWVKLIEVKKLENKERSDNGFGSTGI
jgi:dUTPase